MPDLPSSSSRRVHRSSATTSSTRWCGRDAKGRQGRAGPKPAEISAILDQYVIGQSAAKEDHPCRWRVQPLQAPASPLQDPTRWNVSRRATSLAHRPHRLGQDLLARPWPVRQRALRDGRRTTLTEPATWARTSRTSSRSCRRGATTTSTRPSRHCLHRRDRQDLAQVRQPLHHRDVSGEGGSRPCSSSSRAPSPPESRPQAAASTRTRTSCRWIPPTSCCCGGAFDGLDRSSATVPSRSASVSARRCESRENTEHLPSRCVNVEAEDLIVRPDPRTDRSSARRRHLAGTRRGRC